MASDTASTTPQTLHEHRATSDEAPVSQGSVARRMLLIAAGWIAVLLVGGGIALDRTLINLVERNFDEQLEYILTAMIGSAEIEAGGEVFFNRKIGRAHV